jgi:prevent-host-death family protein
MTTVNALKIRNQFGEVLEMLDQGKDPILIEKRKKVRAVLISYEDYRTRFLDKLADEEKENFLKQVRGQVHPSLSDEDPVVFLRKLRGYED